MHGPTRAFNGRVQAKPWWTANAWCEGAPFPPPRAPLSSLTARQRLIARKRVTPTACSNSLCQRVCFGVTPWPASSVKPAHDTCTFHAWPDTGFQLPFLGQAVVGRECLVRGGAIPVPSRSPFQPDCAPAPYCSQARDSNSVLEPSAPARLTGRHHGRHLRAHAVPQTASSNCAPAQDPKRELEFRAQARPVWGD